MRKGWMQVSASGFPYICGTPQGFNGAGGVLRGLPVIERGWIDGKCDYFSPCIGVLCVSDCEEIQTVEKPVQAWLRRNLRGMQRMRGIL